MAAYMNGGYNGYGRTDPGYDREAYPNHVHHPVILDTDGKKHEIIGYEYHNAQNYVAQTEQVFEIRHKAGAGGRAGLGLGGHNLSPRGKDAHKHQGNKGLLVPWKTADNSHGSPTKAHGHEAIDNGGSPRYNNTYNNKVVHGSPTYSKPRKFVDFSSEGEEESDRGSDYETDDDVCKNGVCYPKPEPRAKANNNHIKAYGDYDNPKPKSNFSDPYYDQRPNSHMKDYGGFDKPKPTANFSDPYSDQNPNNHMKDYGGYDKPKPKANFSDQNRPDNHHYYTHSPPSYTVPTVTAQPRKDTSYTRPISSSNPPPIKTKPDHNGRKFQEYASPQAKEGNSKPIDSSEARRRYGGIEVPSEKRPEQKYSGTIDCKTAAEKYKGVFVKGNNF